MSTEAAEKWPVIGGAYLVNYVHTVEPGLSPTNTSYVYADIDLAVKLMMARPSTVDGTGERALLFTKSLASRAVNDIKFPKSDVVSTALIAVHNQIGDFLGKLDSRRSVEQKIR
jgi:hypothetical protein